MKLTGGKRQTVFLTGINSIVRALGLIMRIWISRLVGAEVMGIMELAQSVHMTAIAPLTSGLPAAVTRITAKANQTQKKNALASGMHLVRKTSFILVPLLWVSSPVIARCMGDIRVLPSLWFTAPCILILGYSGVYNGYCYGIEKTALPALSELIEQAVRFFLTIFLIKQLRFLTPSWQAAVPVSATMIAEIAGLWYVMACSKGLSKTASPSGDCIKEVFHLALPTTLTRIIQTLLRSFTAMLIPRRLQVSGLTPAESTGQLGMLNGMVVPVLMMPGIFTSALSMVLIPKIAKAEEKPSELRRLILLSMYGALPLSFLCSLTIYFFSDHLANIVYHQPELSRLFRLCAWQVLLHPINHLIGSTLSALGLQRRLLSISSIGSVVSLFLTWHAAAVPDLRISGVIFVQYVSQMLSILLGIGALFKWKLDRNKGPDDKSV